MSRRMTVRQTLQHVADYPVMVEDDMLTVHTGELIARTLYKIANSPDAQVRGSMARATKARSIIFNRLAGRRRAGSPVDKRSAPELVMTDLIGESSE